MRSRPRSLQIDTGPAVPRENVDVCGRLPNRASTATTVPLWLREAVALTEGGRFWQRNPGTRAAWHPPSPASLPQPASGL